MHKRHVLRLVVVLLLVLVGAWYRSVSHTPAPATPELKPAENVTTDAPALGQSGADALHGPVAHADVGFRTREKLDGHFAKHGAEFGARDAAEYLRLAQSLRDHAPDAGIVEATRRDGVTCRFDRRTGAFIAYERDLVIRTFFKPNDGEAYFRRQLAREH